MKAYSIDFREKIVKAYEEGNTSIRKVASRFGVAKSFVQKLQFSPTNSKMVDVLMATALDLVNPLHLKNWFTNCCYCTS